MEKKQTRKKPIPEEDTEFYAIKTGLNLIDENTESGESLAVFMCSGDQNGASWFEDTSKIDSEGRLQCQTGLPRHGKHEVLSFDEGLKAGLVALVGSYEGAVSIGLRELLLGHRRLAEMAKRQKARRAS